MIASWWPVEVHSQSELLQVRLLVSRMAQVGVPHGIEVSKFAILINYMTCLHLIPNMIIKYEPQPRYQTGIITIFGMVLETHLHTLMYAHEREDTSVVYQQCAFLILQ